MDATFAYGNYATVHHTPAGAVTAGKVMVVGVLALIAHHDIAATVQGVLGAGRAVYKVVANAAIAVGLLVYWDDTAKKVTVDSAVGANMRFGYVVTAALADGDVIEVLHSPK